MYVTRTHTRGGKCPHAELVVLMNTVVIIHADMRWRPEALFSGAVTVYIYIDAHIILVFTEPAVLATG